MKKLLMILALVPTMAQANDFFTGNQLWSKMNDADAIPRMVALGYIAGVASAFSGTAHCSPSTVTTGQVQDVVKAFMQNSPETRHERATLIVLAALMGAWPCANIKGL